MSGGAAHFHGTGDGYVGNSNYSGNAISVCAWVWHDRFRSGQIERSVTVGGHSFAVIRKEYDGRLHFYIGTGDDFQHLWVDNVLNEGKWQHVAGTWGGLVLRLYLDGLEIPTQ